MNFVRIIFNLFRFDRANWKAVSLCVLTAIIFWTFNAFNKDHSTNVRFPILFEFDGAKYVPAEHLPKYVNVNVSGNGWDLFRKYIGLKVPQIIIPLERPSEIKKIVGSNLLPVIATQIGSLKINFVVTDTLYLQVDKRDAHRFRLVADVSGVTFHQGYGRISPVVVLPDSIELDGPESRLHAIIDSIFLSVDKENVKENFREEVDITFIGSDFVKRDPPVAQIMFEVGPVQEVVKRFKVSNDKKIVSVQDSVTVKFQVPIARLADFDLISKDVFVKANGDDLKKYKSVIPRVFNLPSYVQLLSVDSVHSKLN